MVWTIVKQELRDHVMSLRFSAIFVLAVLLMVTSVMVFSVSYTRAVGEYPKRVAGFVNEEGKVNLMMVSCQSGTVVRSLPSSLAFCSATSERELPNQAVMAAHGLSAIGRSAEPGEILSASGTMDWTFVITVLLSFGAGLLTYKSISGERRDGTLTLVLSNPLSRGTLLLGKYLAALIALAVVFFVAMLISLIALQSLGTVRFGPDDWMKIGLFGFVGIVYLSLFVLTGLLCSVFTRGPVLSAVAFLFVWTGLVFVIPNLGGVLAGQVGNVRTPLQMHEAANALADQLTLTPAMSADAAASVKLRREETRERLLIDYTQSLIQQVQLGQDLTCLSPASVFSYAAERIVGGGTFRLMHFVNNAVRFREGFLQAIIDADKLDPRSEHHYVPWWCGGNHFSQMTVDPGAAKEFRDMLPSSSEGVTAAAWNIFLLILYNVIGFAVAFWRFARQDVAPAPGM